MEKTFKNEHFRILFVITACKCLVSLIIINVDAFQMQVQFEAKMLKKCISDNLSCHKENLGKFHRKLFSTETN